MYGPVAEERAIAMRHTEGQAAPLLGSRQLLFQAISNLVDNAIKNTPAGGAISLDVGADAKETRLVVADTGPGIPEGDRERVLEPFVRLDVSRSTPGSCLGLALVAAIVRLHGGRIELGDNHPGLRVALVFPRAP
jgi:signal transduction histidine kinase